MANARFFAAFAGQEEPLFGESACRNREKPVMLGERARRVVGAGPDLINERKQTRGSWLGRSQVCEHGANKRENPLEPIIWIYQTGSAWSCGNRMCIHVKNGGRDEACGDSLGT
ncbi:unnamed protein product [Fusarium graminearum]|nr:unnamed protein product [Fusarium graminearum]